MNDKQLTHAEVAALAAEAKRGYDPAEITRAPGRPRMDSAPATVLSVRLHTELLAAVKRRAAVEQTSVSELVRNATLRYLETEPPRPEDLAVDGGDRIMSGIPAEPPVGAYVRSHDGDVFIHLIDDEWYQTGNEEVCNWEWIVRHSNWLEMPTGWKTIWDSGERRWL